MVNSKKKGGRFELEIAKLLTESTKHEWARVGVTSGSRRTAQGLKNNAMRGDVYCDDDVDNIYKDWTIETKAYKSVTLNDLFNISEKKGLLYKWIKQCEDESITNHYILFFKINNMGTYMLIPFELQSIVEDMFNINSNGLTISIGISYKLYKVD